MPGGIYAIECRPTLKVYVGSALNIPKRWDLHRYHLKKGSHHSVLLQRAWDKYGATSFDFRVIEHVDDQGDLILREQFWIETLEAADRKSGLNLCPTAGSRLGRRVSSATKAKMSAAKKGKPVHNAESRARMSATRRGRKHGPMSAETRAKLSAAKRGIPCPAVAEANKRRVYTAEMRERAAHQRGAVRTFTPEHRAAISRAKAGKALSAKARVAALAALSKAREINARAAALAATQ